MAILKHSARGKGFDAFLQGKSLNDNPYELTLEDHYNYDDWQSGWMLASSYRGNFPFVTKDFYKNGY